MFYLSVIDSNDWLVGIGQDFMIGASLFTFHVILNCLCQYFKSVWLQLMSKLWFFCVKKKKETSFKAIPKQ